VIRTDTIRLSDFFIKVSVPGLRPPKARLGLSTRRFGATGNMYLHGISVYNGSQAVYHGSQTLDLRIEVSGCVSLETTLGLGQARMLDDPSVGNCQDSP